jgi:hydroxyethylthiazole kinase-like sugar kinase family protein
VRFALDCTANRDGGMPLRRLFLLLLSSLMLLGLAAISPAAALAAAKGTDHPLVTGAATSSFTGHVCPLGAITGADVVTFTVTGPTTFTYAGTDTLVAANGNEVFSTLTGSGTFTSSTTTQSTQVNTITGGTGRYADASGTFTETISSVVVSVTATSETTDNAATFNGQISY